MVADDGAVDCDALLLDVDGAGVLLLDEPLPEPACVSSAFADMTT